MSNSKNQNRSLPDGFNWSNYEQLAQIDDIAIWCHQFALRDPNYSESNKVGTMSTGITISEGTLWRTDWRNGVLSDGMNGHQTHDYLRGIVEYASKEADYLTAEELSKAKSDGTLSQYATRRTKGTGALCFKTREDYENFRTAESAAFSRTVELAINMMMPKDMILSEVSALIDRYQKGRFRSDFSLEVDSGKQFQVTGKQKTWARGLACWDLVHDGFSIYQVAKLLAVDWYGTSNSKDPVRDSRKKVKELIDKISPLINGGWKALAGDPTVSIDSSILKREYTEGHDQ
ncbi:MAG: hypothetical protein N0E58_04825 [Candidatus Thiodiazotropha endolucinida]|uniref:Uncharacterized protein n=1 Tax=Candidatus Thiodiazotropha taylori TaxID=2792791 RepID=A0A9E4NHN6_9GAMM|nr:hypothetical protein [Candidatus Thiodiazotropha taylori]MCW4235574.1 hypothetical protein [Candidatus Thiodiazotropha endolucinida]